MSQFKDLKALFINCSIKQKAEDSHTMRLVQRAAGVMRKEGVDVEVIHALDYQIAFGMVKDATKETGAEVDDWPEIHKKIMDADILVLASPIWLGVKASVATLVIERMYAYSGEKNEKGQYLYYGKAGGCLITGNEDGAKACAMDMLYALSHIGYTIPPQADAAWLGEAGPGPSYGDKLEDGSKAGYDNEFTNKNTTFMAWNLMHMARLLKDTGGITAKGNVADEWPHVTNARDQNPEYR